MIGDRAGEGARHRVEPRDAGEEIGELVDAVAEPSHAAEHERLAGEKTRIVGPDHPGARARWRDHVVARLELGQQLLGERARRAPIARVEARLTAAGLRRRYVYLATGRLEQLDGGKADARAHQVDETGDEETDAHHVIGSVDCKR